MKQENREKEMEKGFPVNNKKNVKCGGKVKGCVSNVCMHGMHGLSLIFFSS